MTVSRGHLTIPVLTPEVLGHSCDIGCVTCRETRWRNPRKHAWNTRGPRGKFSTLRESYGIIYPNDKICLLRLKSERDRSIKSSNLDFDWVWTEMTFSNAVSGCPRLLGWAVCIWRASAHGRLWPETIQFTLPSFVLHRVQRLDLQEQGNRIRRAASSSWEKQM